MQPFIVCSSQNWKNKFWHIFRFWLHLEPHFCAHPTRRQKCIKCGMWPIASFSFLSSFLLGCSHNRTKSMRSALCVIEINGWVDLGIWNGVYMKTEAQMESTNKHFSEYFRSYAFVMINSYHTTSIKRPIALVYGPSISKISQYYFTRLHKGDRRIESPPPGGLR